MFRIVYESTWSMVARMKRMIFFALFLAAGILPFFLSAATDVTSWRKDAFWAFEEAESGFGNPSNSLPQLQAKFEEFLTDYPGSKFEQQAKQTAAVLTRMMAEEKSHPQIAPSNLTSLPPTDRVRELIFQLRYENKTDATIGGIFNGLFRYPPDTNSPAQELLDIGYPAVPQLIDSLGDQTLTRSLRQTSTFSYTPMAVDDWTIEILQRVAGKSFSPPFEMNGFWLSQEKRMEMTHEAIQAWWKEFQQKGEERMLVEGAEKGDADSPKQGEYLLARYPNIALGSLIRGARAATNDLTRTMMVQLFSKFDSPEARKFLAEEMHGGDHQSNVKAAEIWRRWDKPEALRVMIHSWETSTNGDRDGDAALIGFLALANSPEAIAALAHNFSLRPVHARYAVVDGLGGIRWGGDAWKTNFSRGTLEAMQAVLVAALEDEDRELGLAGGTFDHHRGNKQVSYSDPRICDMAGFYLDQGWPQRYDFDLSASLQVRNRQRIDCQNVWRKAHNMSLLPSPSLDTVQ
jgi:hypothetical protein